MLTRMSTEMTAAEIIDALDGPTAVARMLNIRAPSVCDWYANGIPEGRLIELAARLEAKSEGRFSRKRKWPDRYLKIWPELAEPLVHGAPSSTPQITATQG
jgi:hypothetical protein